MSARVDASPCPTPWWLPDGHTQTIYAARFAPCPRVTYSRERLSTPDGDFIDIDWVVPGVDAGRLDAAIANGIEHAGIDPLLPPGPQRHSRRAVMVFHGLEGCSSSHYALALSHHFRARGWVVAVPHFRGCSGTANRLLRAYHSGDVAEVRWLVEQVAARLPEARWHAVGVSLGGNALARYLGAEVDHSRALRAAAVVSAPLDLLISGNHLGQGLLQRELYTRMFLRTLKAKVLRKAQKFPGAFDAWRVAHARTLRAFDDAYTAPVHGFRDVDDYWTRASARPGLSHIETPTLLLNARNDPFVPASCLPGPRDASRAVVLHQPATGGHAGFVTGSGRGHLHWLPRRIERFFGTGH